MISSSLLVLCFTLRYLWLSLWAHTHLGSSILACTVSSARVELHETIISRCYESMTDSITSPLSVYILSLTSGSPTCDLLMGQIPTDSPSLEHQYNLRLQEQCTDASTLCKLALIMYPMIIVIMVGRMIIVIMVGSMRAS